MDTNPLRYTRPFPTDGFKGFDFPVSKGCVHTKPTRYEQLKTQLAAGKLTETGKIELLALAIVAALAARQTVSEHDLTQCGMELAEAKRLYDPAFARARRLDPKLFAAVAA